MRVRSMANIYHVVPRREWERQLHNIQYRHTSLDAEGFIHCSLAAQCKGVVDRYFRDEEELLVLVMDPTLLESEVRFEGKTEHFPHVYGAINRSAITGVVRWEELKEQL